MKIVLNCDPERVLEAAFVAETYIKSDDFPKRKLGIAGMVGYSRQGEDGMKKCFAAAKQKGGVVIYQQEDETNA